MKNLCLIFRIEQLVSAMFRFLWEEKEPLSPCHTMESSGQKGPIVETYRICTKFIGSSGRVPILKPQRLEMKNYLLYRIKTNRLQEV